MAEYCESSHLPEVGEVPTNQSIISFQDASLASPKLQSRFSWIIVWNIWGYFCLSYFFIYVSVSNLHFPQMKLVSEKPPEPVLGVIFLEEHAP